MKLLLNSLFIIHLLMIFTNNVLADGHAEPNQEKSEKSNIVRGGSPLTEDEVKSNKLWLDNHLGNITQPTSLYYEFEKTGTYEDGFSDSVYLKVLELNEDGTKNTLLDFFTAERKQKIPEGNTSNIRGNPVLGIYMNGDVFDMARITGGKPNRYRYFLKQIKVALRETAKIETITFIYNGQEYKGDKIFFTPYVEDPHRREFEKFADKYYEIILSDDIPGKLYQITTIVPDKSSESAEPLVVETLKLVSVDNQES